MSIDALRVPGAAMKNPLTIEQRRALQMVANSAHGCTEPAMQAKGFPVATLIGLVGAGFLSAKPQIMKVGDRAFGVVRFLITDAGRRAIEHLDVA